MDNSNSKSNNSKKKNNKDDKKEKNLGSEVTEAWKEFIKDPEKAKKEINDIVAGVGKENSDRNLLLCHIGGAGVVTVSSNVCETCGKNFRTSRGLNVHRSLKHLRHLKQNKTSARVDDDSPEVVQVNPDPPLTIRKNVATTVIVVLLGILVYKVLCQ